MKVLYYIKTKDGWKQVTSDEYWKFDGEKQMRPEMWHLTMMIPYLVSLRWN